jgi:hypothetical protein
MPFQEGDLSETLWSADGRTLCAAGKYSSDEVHQVLCWSNAGKGKLSAFAAAGDTIMGIRALHDGAIAFGSSDGSVGVIGRTGAAEWRAAPELLDYRVGSDFPLVSSDGNDFETYGGYFNGATWTRHKISFSVTDERLEFDSRQTKVSLQPPTTRGLAVNGWHNSFHPTLDGRALKLNNYERSQSLAIAPDKSSFILGTQWTIRKFNRQGELIWRSSVPDTVWGVNITADARFVIAALNDGTVRWYTFEKGEEVLALFVDRDLQRWVAWNPDGFFTFKGGGDALIGYQVNHGPAQAGEFVKVDQLRDVFYRADLIDQIFKPGGAEKILAARDRVGDVSRVLSGGLPPEIELISPDHAEVADEYTLQFRVKNRGGGQGRIVYRLDDAEIEGRRIDVRGSGNDTTSRGLLKGTEGDTLTFTVPIGSGGHVLTVAAYDAGGKVLGQKRTIQLSGVQAVKPSNLYVVAAGISHYFDTSLDVGARFAAGDADLVADRFQAQEGKGLFPHVHAVSLPDSKATVKNIQNAVAEAAKIIGPSDTFILYLAGHGVAIDGEYYFIPWEAKGTDQKNLLAKSLNRAAIQELLRQVHTNKSVLILDTCGAGAFLGSEDLDSDNKAIQKVAMMSGHVVLAASNYKTIALEGYQNHGVFTYFLVEGISSADSDAKGEILVTRLGEYTQKWVPQITEQKWHYRQVPVAMYASELFPIAHKAAK